MTLWNGRFEEKPDKALTDFTESISFDKKLYKYDILGSKAHAQMLKETGIISESSCEKITSGLNKIEKEIDSGNFEFKSELEDIHMHIESALIKEIGEDGAKLHTARSRNDQIALDIRLYLQDHANLTINGIKKLQHALLIQAERNIDAIMPGYTHLQRAQPVLFAHHLLAYVEMLERDTERLADFCKRLNVCPLGSGAIAGTTLPIDRNKSAQLLNFSKLSQNSMDAISDRDFACELLADLAIFGMHISRLSEDIIIWMTSEFKFVELSDAFCTGSSLMPQKKNPDIAELSRGKSARLYGNMIAIFTLMKGLPLSYNRDMQEDKESIFDSVETVLKILSVYPSMIFTMKVNKDRMSEAASDPMLMATDIAEHLVTLGIPFRTAHHKVGALVKWCNSNGTALNKLTIEQLKMCIPEADEAALTLFSAESSVAKRNIVGGTSSEQVRKQISLWKEKLSILCSNT